MSVELKTPDKYPPYLFEFCNSFYGGLEIRKNELSVLSNSQGNFQSNSEIVAKIKALQRNLEWLEKPLQITKDFYGGNGDSVDQTLSDLKEKLVNLQSLCQQSLSDRIQTTWTSYLARPRPCKGVQN